MGCGAWNGADVLVEALLANASDAIAVSDRESGRYVMASDSYCRLTGYAREELIGRTSVELGLIASYAARSEGLDRAIRGTRGVHELRLRRKDGAIRVLEFSVTLLAGGPLMLSVSRDVTERRALEAQLRASELRLRAAVESMPDAFSIASAVRDEHGEIVDFRWQYVNNAYCALVGFDRDQLLQRRGSELFAEFPSSERFAIYRRAAITGEPCQIVTTCSPGAQRAGAPPRLVEYSVAAIGGDIAVWGRDITERHSAEAKLAASEQRFRVAVESMLDAFTIISAVRDDQGEIVDFRYEYVNEAYCRLIGSDREQILGRRGAELMAAFTDSKRFETYRQVVITGEPCRIEDVVQAAAPAGAALAARLIDINIVAMGENLVVLGRDVT